MELALIILAIGVVYWLNNDNIDIEKLKQLTVKLDKELSKEFKKRDDKIEKLEKEIKELKKGHKC